MFRRGKGGAEEQLQTSIKPVKCTVEFSEVIDEYSVGPVRVTVGLTAETGTLPRPLYCIDEPEAPPELLFELSKAYDALAAEGYTSLPEDLELLRKLGERYGFNAEVIVEHYLEAKYYIDRAASGYGPLYPLIRDPMVEEVAVDRPGSPASVYHRRLSSLGWVDTNIVLDESELDDLVLRLARRAGRNLSIAHPYIEGLLPEGHRLAATFSREVTRFGSSLVIRKHLQRPLSVLELAEEGMISLDIAAYLWLLVDYKVPVMIVGPTAAGKTTLLQALLGLIPSARRIVTIEDTPELNLQHHPRWDSLVARHVYAGEAEDVDIYKLAKFALRRRADYLVIGEVRGEEARVLVHAAASGHGTLTTFHADTPLSAIARLRAPPISIGDAFIPFIGVVVVVRRVQHPRLGGEVRRVVEVVEVVEDTDEPWRLVSIAKWLPSSDEWDAGVGELASRSARLAALADSLGYSRDWVAEELTSRRDYLSTLMEQGVRGFEELHYWIDERFYSTVGVVGVEAAKPTQA